MGRRLAKQAFLIALGAALFSCVGRPSLAWLLLSYLLGLVLWQLPPFRRPLEALRSVQLWVLALLLAAPATAWTYRARARIATEDGLFGASERLRDRWRLQAEPAIAPPLLSSDRPQTFFVSAPAARELRVRFGTRAPLQVAEALGAGLFRVHLDPREHAGSFVDGPLRVMLELDGHSFERELQVVSPLPHPRWFCASPARDAAATPSEETDELFVVDARREVRRVATGDGPVDCVWLDAQRVLVSHRYGAGLRAFDLARANTSRTLSLPGPLGRIALSPDRARLVVAQLGRAPALLVVDPQRLALTAHVALSEEVDWLAFGADANTLVTSARGSATLQRWVAASESYVPVQTLKLGRPAVTMARSSDGSQLWLAATDFRPDGAEQLGNHFVQDQLIAVESGSLRVLERRLTARRSERQSKPGDVDKGTSPMGLGALQAGGFAVTFAGSDGLGRVAPQRADFEIIDLAPSGLFTPHGVVELSDGSLLLSSPVTAALGVLAPGATEPKVLPLGASEATLRGDQSARRAGERGFFETTRSGIACQSCHIHADSDRAAYNLGDHRLAATLSVRGLFGTAPYLRDGSYARIRDLDEVAQTLYRGYLRPLAQRAETLEAYITGLPRPDPLPEQARDLAAERRGYAVFRKAGCPRCHVPPAFTNLAQLPVGALFPQRAAALPDTELVDVPTLLSLSASAPYFNDGRARDLRAVLDDNEGSNLHGDTRALGSDDRADLIRFLEAL